MKHNPYRLVLTIVWLVAAVVGAFLAFGGLNARANGDVAAGDQLLAVAYPVLAVGVLAFLLWFVVSAVIWSIHDVARRGPDDEPESS